MVLLAMRTSPRPAEAEELAPEEAVLTEVS
jgi:hypothetical protein